MSHAVAERLGVARGRGRAVGWWGTVLLIVTEGILFALLLFVWFYLRGQASAWPPQGVRDPELVRVSIRSGLLFASSATMAFAERGIRRGLRWRLHAGLVVTFLLAAVFLAGHMDEMLKLHRHYTWAQHAYGSARYTILNFHAAHLVVGMAAVAFTFFAALRGRYAADDHLGVQITGLYWHFVDVVWLFVFAALYLLPNAT